MGLPINVCRKVKVMGCCWPVTFPDNDKENYAFITAVNPNQTPTMTTPTN